MKQHLLAKLKYIAVSVSLAIALFSLPALAANPNIEWHKIETDHFEIIYDSKHYQLAKDFARHAETAWQTLVPVLRTWPDKTVVVIDDSGDSANGMATGFPYPQIHLYPATPVPGETIADTGPWGLELVMHEYTHVLNFQPAHGFFHNFRNIFGSIVRPNLLLPRWYLEGLAVETETRFSPSGGRLRSADFTAIPRAMIQDNLLRREDIARIGDTTNPDWPGGIRPYLIGGLIWNHLTKNGLSIVGDLNDHYARRMPFFIDTPIEEKTGQTWQGVLDAVYTDLEARAVHQIEVICEGGCNEGTKLGENGFYTRSPVLSRRTEKGATKPIHDALAYFSREHNRDSVLMIATRGAAGFDTKNALRVTEVDGANRISWLPDATALMYDAIDSVGRYEERSDLWVYDRERKKNTRVTKGWRAREPGVSPSGKSVVFVQLTPGKSGLAVASISRDSGSGKTELGKPKTIYQPGGETRVSWPEFIANDAIVFAERTVDGKEVLKLISFNEGKLESGTPRSLVTGGSGAFPRLIYDGQGRRHLLFSSARTGVTNLYVGRLTPASEVVDLVPVTNSTTRAWVGDFDSETLNLLYSRLDGDGSHLRSLTKEERELMVPLQRGRLTKVEPLIAPPTETYDPTLAKISSKELQAHDFSSWPYMIPRYWMPYAAFVPGGAFLSANTSAGDPLGHHSIAASISMDTRIGKPNVFGAYSYGATDVRYTILADDFWQRLSTTFDRRSTTGDLSALFYINGLSNSWRGEAGLSHQRTELPTAGGTDVRIRGGMRAGILWQDQSQRGFEISPEKGGVFRFTHSRFLPEVGNLVYDKTDLTLATNLSRTSHPKWLGFFPDRHVLAMSANVSWLPGLDRLLLGPSSVSLPVETVALGATSTSFIMRGYPSGTFLARKFVRGSLEYRLPLSNTYEGFGTRPGFLRRWHAAVFADVVTVEGAFYDFDVENYRVSQFGDTYPAVGAEARLDSTLFYHLPVQFIFGIHYGFDKRANPNGAYPVISISL